MALRIFGLLLFLFSFPAVASILPLPGDADGDGAVTRSDVGIALRLAAYSPSESDSIRPAVDLLPVTALGCHGDGRVDVTDAVEVLRLNLGLEPAPSTLPCHLVSPMDGAELALVPAGPFVMGSEDGRKDERPLHEVDLDAFYMDVKEITNQQYEKFVIETGYVSQGDWYTLNTPGREHHPVVNVTWNDALAYTFWAGRRLPTEAEWEKAARGTDVRLWPWGNVMDTARFNFGYTMRDTTPVGSFPDGASPYGMLDMSGNACEWLSDWYGADYYRNSPKRNPRGPSKGFARAVRGGSWEANAIYSMTMMRHWDLPLTTAGAIGFRCALSLQPEADL